MAVPDFAQHVTAQSFAAGTRAHAFSFSTAAKATAGGQAPKGADDAMSFDDLIDIVNPLQHIPVVSTIYRAITGDQEKPIAEIAGGALYGGLLGLASSLADVAFEKVTGRNFGDTILALFDGGNSSDANLADNTKTPAQVAARQAPAAVAPAQAMAPGSDALVAAVDSKHVDPGVGQRALFAYQRSIGLNATMPTLATQ